jgi:hypothetical protein
MALTAQEVRVAGAGHVFVAPEGTVIPETLDTLPPSWVDAGYVTTDGVAFTFSRETEDLDAWQGDKIRVLTTREPATVAFSLMQTNSDVVVLAMGGGSVTEESIGLFKYVPPRGDNMVRAFIIEFTDEGVTYRYCVPRAQVEGDVSYTLTRAGAVVYPLTFGLLENDPKYFILSDDAAMGDGSLPGTIGGEGGAGPVLGTVGATQPAPVQATNSIFVDSDDGKTFISDGATWEDTTQTLTPIPPAGGVIIGTVDPSAGAGVPAATNAAFFRNTGSNYTVWRKGAGADTVWSSAGITIPLN